MRYTEEEKKAALESLKKIGVKKTQEKLNISPQTLYKWRNEQKPTDSEVEDATAANALQAEDSYLREKIEQLEAENIRLRSINGKLKKALLAAIE